MVEPTALPEISALGQIIPRLLIVVFAVMPVMMTIELLWQLIGKEVAEISDDDIIVRHQVFGLGIARHYRASDINGLFVSQSSKSWLSRWMFSSRQYQFFDFKRGKIAFNCGRTIWGSVKTFRFGTSLDEAEARQVVSLIHKRFPQYVCNRQQRPESARCNV